MSPVRRRSRLASPGLRAVAWACVLLALAPAVRAQTSSSLTLRRADAEIELVNRGRADEGARTLLGVPGCVPGEEVRSSIFYAPEGGVRARITQDEDGGETLVHAPLMTVRRPEGEQGEESETLEALDAAATIEDACLADVDVVETPAVRLEQGRTTVVGGRFFLDQETDVATMDGPVALTREPDGEGPAVEAEAEALRFDLESDRSTLTGDVRVVAGDRVSRADELELDEAAGLAILRGSPAVSRDGEDEVRGSRLLYDLETNDVVVEGGVSASFEWDGEAVEATPAEGDESSDTAPGDGGENDDGAPDEADPAEGTDDAPSPAEPAGDE